MKVAATALLLSLLFHQGLRATPRPNTPLDTSDIMGQVLKVHIKYGTSYVLIKEARKVAIVVQGRTVGYTIFYGEVKVVNIPMGEPPGGFGEREERFYQTAILAAASKLAEDISGTKVPALRILGAIQISGAMYRTNVNTEFVSLPELPLP